MIRKGDTKDATGNTVIVPYHSKAMKKGLEQAILKQAGLK
ncbi:MAG: type II toxin-antitoxin system HicA family toxin [Lachnospiraceae bacterium]|nr:type II toxin-antitoxin system HicA family toxin [Lachnospiraceae bacterium]